MIFIIIHYTVYVVARNAPPSNDEERCVTTLKTAV